jgi:hypothetical protein
MTRRSRYFQPEIRPTCVLFEQGGGTGHPVRQPDYLLCATANQATPLEGPNSGEEK